MSLFKQINEDIKSAMLNKEKDKLEALRAIKAAFLLAKTETGIDEIPAEKEISIVQKLVKQRRDSALIYQQNNRPELEAKENMEADYIAEYLPQQMSEKEIVISVQAIIEQVGASSMKDMGKVMGMATKQLAGKADGKLIADCVKKALA